MSDCYTHNPYVPYMPDMIHVDSCPHTAVDNTLVIRMVCARSDGVLSGSWVHVPRPPRFHTRVFQPFRSRFPSRDLYGFPYGFTARSTLVAYRYLGQTFQDTQDVSRWLWLLLPLHRYGASRHLDCCPGVSS